jgi:hypothetical protein
MRQQSCPTEGGVITVADLSTSDGLVVVPSGPTDAEKTSQLTAAERAKKAQALPLTSDDGTYRGRGQIVSG